MESGVCVESGSRKEVSVDHELGFALCLNVNHPLLAFGEAYGVIGVFVAVFGE